MLFFQIVLDCSTTQYLLNGQCLDCPDGLQSDGSVCICTIPKSEFNTQTGICQCTANTLFNSARTECIECVNTSVNSDRTTCVCNSKTGESKQLGYDETRSRCCLENEYYSNGRCYACPPNTTFVDDEDIDKRTCKCNDPAHFNRESNTCACDDNKLYYDGACKACDALPDKNIAGGLNSSKTGCNCNYGMEFDISTWSCACRPTQYYNSEKSLCLSCPLVSGLKPDKTGCDCYDKGEFLEKENRCICTEDRYYRGSECSACPAHATVDKDHNMCKC